MSSDYERFLESLGGDSLSRDMKLRANPDAYIRDLGLHLTKEEMIHIRASVEQSRSTGNPIVAFESKVTKGSYGLEHHVWDPEPVTDHARDMRPSSSGGGGSGCGGCLYWLVILVLMVVVVIAILLLLGPTMPSR